MESDVEEVLRHRLRTVVPISSLTVLGRANSQARSVRCIRQHFALSEFQESPLFNCRRHQSSLISSLVSCRFQKNVVSQAFQLLQTEDTRDCYNLLRILNIQIVNFVYYCNIKLNDFQSPLNAEQRSNGFSVLKRK
jgi:hypothetical protein